MDSNEDDKQTEIHQIQFVDQNGETPLSISILVRYQRPNSARRDELISDDDILDVHEELNSFTGSITPYLTNDNLRS